MNAPCLNENRKLIKGVICGVRVESIEEPLMQEIRYLDKLIDELAKGKAIEKIFALNNNIVYSFLDLKRRFFRHTKHKLN